MGTPFTELYWLNKGRLLDAYLKETLSPERYQHSRRVARVARVLAARFGESPSRAWFAGLAHDVAREWSAQELRVWIQNHGDELLPDHREKEILAHGHAGAWLLQQRFGVRRHSVLEAIRHHTLGLEHLDTLGLIIFAADYMEPGRKFTSRRFRRHASRLDLERMVLACVAHNEERGKDTSRLTKLLAERLSKELPGGIVQNGKENG